MTETAKVQQEENRDVAAAGTVVSIHTAPDAGEGMASLNEVEALAGAGLVGDRYFRGRGTYSGADTTGRQVTLIESEAIDAASAETRMNIQPRDSRRNIVTRGARLNGLVGREFTIGEVRLRGVELCEPCSHLAELAGKPLIRSLVHRGGIRADILSDGMIRVGDALDG
jgi:MOSC domain-containing protein YiiM